MVTAMPTRRFIPLTLLAIMAAVVQAPQPVLAAAWTLAPGAVFVSLTASRYDPDGQGEVPEVTVGLYAEAGILPWLTLGGAVETKADRRVGLGGETTANSGDVFVRARLREGAVGDPLSVQLGFIGPLTKPDPATGLFAEERAVDARVLYGRGFQPGWGDAFVNAEGGVRWLLEDGADELRLDLTAGLRPVPRLLVMVQAFGVRGLRNNAPFGSDYDSLKLVPSVGYDLGPATLLLGAERTVAGRNADRGLRLKMSIWRSF
jgi:hypothetical protein